MYTTLFLLAFLIHKINAFSCPNDNGMYVNPDDYRSYYVCTNRCAKLANCVSPTVYFTRTNQACVAEPPDWRTRFDLSGQFKSSDNTDVFVQQDKYQIFITHATNPTVFKAIARYINETHAVGIQTAQRLVNNCIAVFNIRIVATGIRAHCYYETLHPFSSRCDLPEDYSGNYCKTY
jgi:hypothetical protein